ncbi:unnamed protein product [Bursaphelenchus xylophilus]|uniref:(pine wood nematode) hypothetical protein n=1 Tax=Bursaphelenchus xylophilus TaxID=6326 RepID=A0A1I7SF93_BURXY|nr:unnamed protein product [Bursaphelenchus xylophilus]CAG9130457.1 unnamed protein product [Bursaphelenchus xylophilus]
MFRYIKVSALKTVRRIMGLVSVTLVNAKARKNLSNFRTPFIYFCPVSLESTLSIFHEARFFGISFQQFFIFRVMPIFGDISSPYDEAVEKVTAETLTTENWALMMDVSDRVASQGQKGAKQALYSIKKRLNHRDPHVVLLALSLLDCIWNNAGQVFRREVSSNDFINELSYRATSSNRLIGEKTRGIIKKWIDNECKKDASLSLIESLYRDLREEGYSFEASEPAKKSKVMFSNDPNVVSTEQEEADIAKAIALSLSEVDKKNKFASPMPVMNQVKSTPKDVTIRQVKALYDFEAAEDNELSFKTGDLINVFDESDVNWWRGQLVKGGTPGLFPASFVTSDLQEKPEEIVPTQPEVVEEEAKIDEEVLKKCLDLLRQCDPTGVVPDDPDLSYFEQMSMAQVPLVNQKLAQIDKQHNMLAKVDVAIRDVLAQYDQAVQQASFQCPSQPSQKQYPGPAPAELRHAVPHPYDPSQYQPRQGECYPDSNYIQQGPHHPPPPQGNYPQ